LDAWQGITSANSFERWKQIGAAPLVGKRKVLYLTGANRACGSRYSREFNQWLGQHHFDRMPASTRSVAIELAENEQAITIWRNALPEKRRRRLVHPLSVTRRWKAETQPSDDRKSINIPKQNNGSDLARDAWRRFVSCMGALPPDQAAPLWIEAQARAAEL
jgi:hypothetical protein